mgnify:CR=1 FL=1
MNWFSHPSLLLRNGYYLNAFVLRSVGDYLSTCTCVHKRLKCLQCGFEREERLWNVCVVFLPKSLGLPVMTSHLKLCYFHLNRVDLHFGDSPPWQSVINTNFMKASRYLNYEHVIKFFNFLEQISYFWMTIPCPHA